MNSVSNAVAPKFGAIFVDKAGIAKSGLGDVTAKTIADKAERLNNDKHPLSLVKLFENEGVDIYISRSQEPDVVETDLRQAGFVKVTFKKAAKFEPATPITIGSFDNRYDSYDSGGSNFVDNILIQGAMALNAASTNTREATS